MQHILTVFVATLVIAIQCTPLPSNSQAILLPAVHQHYLHLPLQHSTQYRLIQPTIKLSEPLVQNVAPLTKLNLPKEQVFYLQQPIGSTPAYQPVLLKQGDTDWIAIIQNFFTNFGSSSGQSESESPAENAEQPDAGVKVEKPQLLPASTTALTPDNRYYIISGQPQFYSTFDALRAPISPLVSFQTLQPIIQARSASAALDSEPSSEPLLPAASEESPAIVPKSEPLVVASDELPQPQQFVQLETLSEIQQQRSMVDGDLQPFDVEPIVKEQIAVLNQARSQQSSIPAAANSLIENSVIAKEIDDSDAGSIAQAKPSAIAVSGRGGTSSADPVATAITGENGISLAAPRATAVAGDFDVDTDTDYDKKKN